MATPVWPASLPDSPLKGYRVRWPDQVLRSQMDSGRSKRRRRSRYEPRVFEMAVDLKTHPDPAQDQLAIWRAFFEETLAYGTLAFDWTDPDDGAVLRFMIRTDREPRTTRRGSVHLLQLTLEAVS